MHVGNTERRSDSSAEKESGWNISLFLPALDPLNSRPWSQGQRVDIGGGIWFPRGRLGERTYDAASGRYYKRTHVFGDRLKRQVRKAGSEALRLQALYLELGPDDSLHNANYELQFSFTYRPATRAMEIKAYGYRTPEPDGRAKVFTAQTVISAFKQYREELEALVDAQRSLNP